MKTLLLIIFPFISYCQVEPKPFLIPDTVIFWPYDYTDNPIIWIDPCTGKDSTPIRQEVFKLVTGKFGLVTTNGELYDNVVFGTMEEIERLKPIEFQNALRRRKAIAFVTIRCKN